nr:hypothetical protein [Qipengyuania aestuarii]
MPLDNRFEIGIRPVQALAQEIHRPAREDHDGPTPTLKLGYGSVQRAIPRKDGELRDVGGVKFGSAWQILVRETYLARDEEAFGLAVAFENLDSLIGVTA